MKSLETLHINDAVGGKRKFDRPRTHLTTMEIGQIGVLMHEELVPGDSYNVRENVFARLAPLAVPTYGSFYFKTATMFVPYYQLFEGAEAFFAGKTISRGKSIHLPNITKYSLLALLTNPSQSTNIVNPSSSSSYDFCYTTNNSVNYKKFTPFGKWVFKILRSLGYQIPNIVSTGSAAVAPTANDKLSALPLLSFFKAYNDYMSQSQRFDTSILTSVLESIRLGVDVANYFTASTGALNYVGLEQLFKLVYLQYENDYFTSCWSSPNNPIGDNTGHITSIPFSNTSTTGSLDGAANSTISNTSIAVSGGIVTSRALDFLRGFDAWIRRNNYSGSKDVQKIYSRFGIQPEDFKAQYSHLLNTSSNIVNVGDVTSLTDSVSSSGTSGAVLGEYAGKGIINGSSGYSYTSDDFGQLITLCWITVKPVYSNGFDRSVLKLSPLDFFNPEFDGIGGNPVSQGEIFVDRKNSSSEQTQENDIFGFNERYCEYKTGNLDQITGDFVIYDDMKSWHFDREDLKRLVDDGNLSAQNTAFNSVNNSTTNQYNRIFNSETDQVDSMSDHFYITAQFDVTAFRPMKSINEVPNLGTGNLTVARNGNTLN